MIRRPSAAFRHAAVAALAATLFVGTGGFGCDDDATAEPATSAGEQPAAQQRGERGERVRASGTASVSGSEGEAGGMTLKSAGVRNSPGNEADDPNSLHLEYVVPDVNVEGLKMLSLWVRVPKSGLSAGDTLDAEQFDPDLHLYDELGYDAVSGPRFNDDAEGTMTIESFENGRLAGEASFTVKSNDRDDDLSVTVELTFADVTLPAE